MRACYAELSSSPASPGLRVRSDSSRVPAGGCVGRPFGFAVTANPTPWGSTLSARESLDRCRKSPAVTAIEPRPWSISATADCLWS